jgi:Tannase and feruloyl esterase
MNRTSLILTLISVSGIHAQVAAEAGNRECQSGAARRDQSGNITRSRPLCQYPLVAKYKGTGSTDDAANFVCSAGF